MRPNFEGRGLGKALLQRAENWLCQQGIKEAWLATSSDPSTRAHQFYKRMGWGMADKLPKNQVRYTKKLDRKPQ